MDVLDWLKQTLKNKKRHHLGQDEILASRINEKEGLIREQRYLADELKRITDHYIEKHERISTALQELDPKDKQAVARIRSLQEKLWTACLRMETALKTMAQIGREAAEWERRDDQGEMSLQHPVIRLEILKSEQHVRNMRANGLPPNKAPESINTQSIPSADDTSESRVDTARVGGLEPAAVAQIIRIQEVHPTHLTRDEAQVLARIKQLINDFHASTESPEPDGMETLRLVQELKREYQELKSQDRQKRIRRHRAQLGDELLRISN